MVISLELLSPFMWIDFPDRLDIAGAIYKSMDIDNVGLFRQLYSKTVFNENKKFLAYLYRDAIA